MNWKEITAVVVLVLLVAAGSGYMRDSRIDTDFPSIQARSDEAAVVYLMGEPAKILAGCDAYGTRVSPSCDHIFLYRSLFYPVRSKYWMVFFDGNKQVTATSSGQEP